MKQKESCWQYLRGLSILAVIACHVPGYFTPELKDANYIFYLCVRQAVSFCVAAFLFVSGYFVVTEKWKVDVIRQIKNRLVRFLIPYFIYSTLYIAWNIFTESISGGEYSIRKIFEDYLLGGAAAPLYYIIVLVQLTLLTPFLIRVQRKSLSILILAISPIYIILLYVYAFNTGSYPDHYNVLFCGWISIYYLGIRCRRNHPLCVFDKIGTVRNCCILYFICIAEAIILTLVVNNGRIATNQLKLSSLMFAACICSFFVNYSNKHQSLKENGLCKKAILLFGDLSYGIFYTHEFAKVPVLIIFNRIGLFPFPLAFLLEWLFTALFSSMVIACLTFVIKKLCVNSKRVIRILGLQ